MLGCKCILSAHGKKLPQHQQFWGKIHSRPTTYAPPLARAWIHDHMIASWAPPVKASHSTSRGRDAFRVSANGNVNQTVGGLVDALQSGLRLPEQVGSPNEFIFKEIDERVLSPHICTSFRAWGMRRPTSGRLGASLVLWAGPLCLISRLPGALENAWLLLCHPGGLGVSMGTQSESPD